MNPFAVIPLLSGLLVITVTGPMIRRKIKPNEWSGIRIPAAFESEAAWFDINEHGGRLLRRWGMAMAATAIAGALLPLNLWLAYNWAALVVALGGLALVLVKISRYARIRKEPNQPARPIRDTSVHL